MSECKSNALLRETSGSIKDSRPLVSFLYELMRDHLPAGDIEQIMRNIESENNQECLFSNGWLALYAKNIADRLS